MSRQFSFVFSVGASFKPLQNEATGSTSTASSVQTTTETPTVNHPDPEHNQSAATTESGDQDNNKTDTETSTNSSPVKSTASKAAAFLSAKMSSTESKKSAKSPEDCKSNFLNSKSRFFVREFNFLCQNSGNLNFSALILFY